MTIGATSNKYDCQTKSALRMSTVSVYINDLDNSLSILTLVAISVLFLAGLAYRSTQSMQWQSGNIILISVVACVV